MVGHVYRLQRRQILPITLQECWEFFSNPHNLARITPQDLKFETFVDESSPFEAGIVMRHRVRPFPGLRVLWFTEITHAAAPRFFVDEQRIGPYRFWRHEHRFASADGGVEMIDVVDYAMPFGPLGRLAHFFRVGAQLERIFDYRRDVLTEIFEKPRILGSASPYRMNGSDGALSAQKAEMADRKTDMR